MSHKDYFTVLKNNFLRSKPFFVTFTFVENTLTALRDAQKIYLSAKARHNWKVGLPKPLVKK